MADGICRTSRQKRRKQQQILSEKLSENITRRKRSKRIRLQRAPWGAEADKKAVFEINSNKDQENPRNPCIELTNSNGEGPEESGAQVEVTGNNIECQRRRFQAVKIKASELSHMYYNGVLDNGTRSVYGAYAHNSQNFSVVLNCEEENDGRQDMELANRTEDISAPCSVIESSEDPQLTTRVPVFLVDDEDERDGVCQAGVAGKKAKKRLGGLRCRKEFGELDQYLDTHIIDRYMEQIWKDLPRSKKDHCTYLDCLWFSMYLEELTSFKILKWIKAKRIFSKRYVFIPIVHWGHWNLLILCHFGDDLRCRSRTPCMLLLDSLKETDPSRLEPLIRKFLVEVHKGEGRKDSEKIISRFPLLVPEVPQQTNGNDCGVFLLHFIDLFLKQAPDSFSTSEDCYPYFLTKDWFKLRDIRLRRKQINDVLLKEQDGTNQMITRRISTRSKKLNGFLSSGRASNWIDLSTGA